MAVILDTEIVTKDFRRLTVATDVAENIFKNPYLVYIDGNKYRLLDSKASKDGSCYKLTFASTCEVSLHIKVSSGFQDIVEYEKAKTNRLGRE